MIIRPLASVARQVLAKGSAALFQLSESSTRTAAAIASQQTLLVDHLLPAGLPKPKDFLVKSATYALRTTSLTYLPRPAKLPEFALIGHSNVGKSSLVNAITGQPGLARVSKTPGHTSALTYYLLNKSYYLVDCPGYGFASVSKSTRKEWHDLTQDYFTSRRTLAMVFLLVDGTQRPQQIDLDCGAWLHENKVPFSVIFTKMDHLMPDNGSLPLLQPAAKLLGANSQRQPGFATQPSNASGTPAPGPVAHDQDQQRAAAENVAQFHGMLSSYCAPDQVPFIATSSATGAGCRLLLKYISQLRQTFAPPSFLDAA